MKTKFFSSVFLCFFFFAIPFCFAENLLKNSSFESGTDVPDSWVQLAWDSTGASQFVWENSLSHSGSRAVSVVSSKENHARFIQIVSVEPNRLYRLSCWIKAEGLPEGSTGAGLGVEGVALGAPALGNTGSEWKFSEIYLRSGSDQKVLPVQVSLGAFGHLAKGKATFDDVTLEEVQAVPANAPLFNLFQEPNSSTSQLKSDPRISAKDYKFFFNWPIENWGLLATVVIAVFTVAAIYLLFLLRKTESTVSVKAKTGKKKKKTGPAPALKKDQESLNLTVLFVVIAIGVAFRFALALLDNGYDRDYGMFKHWLESSVMKGLFNMYHPGAAYIDYPPVYVVVLYLLGQLVGLFGIAIDSVSFVLVLKTPAILADAATAYILFLLARKYMSSEKSLIVAMLFMFNPAVWVDSALWGQIDSVFMLSILATILFIFKDRLGWASFILAASIMTKPQALMFVPLLFFEILRKKDLIVFLRCAGIGILTTVVIALPFTVGNPDPFWLYNLFAKMLGTWSLATINAFNFFAMFGGNWVADSNTFFIFSYAAWGNVFLVVIVLLTGYIYWKSKSPFTLLFAALVLNAGTFNFSMRMHERYLFPSILLLLLIYIFMLDKKSLYLFVGVTVTCFINIFYVYIIAETTTNQQWWIPSFDPVMIGTSALNVLLFFFMLKLTYDALLSKKNAPVAPPES